MVYMSIGFIVFIISLLIIYYMLPLNKRWYVLLAGSIGFYYVVAKAAFGYIILTVIFSFFCGIWLDKISDIGKRKVFLLVSNILVLLPLLWIKEGNYIYTRLGGEGLNLVVPLGISFYTLQIVAYLTDVYKGVISAQRNILKYMLFVTYFPQIVQGPIPRYKTLSTQLFEEKHFDEDLFTKGFMSILWGWFLKFMIADKAGVVVDTIFASPEKYIGAYVLLGGVLYSIQLYTDFQSCVCIARGTSELFGVKLDKNFKQPYFSQNIADFWRRWHISLSSWFRDYIYIPLGGNRKGDVRKYINLMVVFIVSGVWHGEGFKFVFWGCMHGVYQILGGLTRNIRKELWKKVGVREDNKMLVVWRRVFTFLCVMFAWIVFRAPSLSVGLQMIFSAFTVYNPWIFFDDSIFLLGLSWKEMLILVISLLILYKVSDMEEQKSIRDYLLSRNIVIRWGIYLFLIVVIMVFGTYGYGFDAKDFIYGGF